MLLQLQLLPAVTQQAFAGSFCCVLQALSMACAAAARCNNCCGKEHNHVQCESGFEGCSCVFADVVSTLVVRSCLDHGGICDLAQLGLRQMPG
jgi:hypothetical protein